jgi:hypothetical protein
LDLLLLVHTAQQQPRQQGSAATHRIFKWLK